VLHQIQSPRTCRLYNRNNSNNRVEPSISKCNTIGGRTCWLRSTERHFKTELTDSLTEITQPCIHMCYGLFICQLYSLPDLREETDCKEDTPLTLPFASFVYLSQLIIVIWIKTSVGITTVFHTGISRAVAAA
jgi:hypothetical protein